MAIGTMIMTLMAIGTIPIKWLMRAEIMVMANCTIAMAQFMRAE